MRLLLDENFDNDILRGILREKTNLDYIRAQDVPEVYGKGDPVVLEWAASQNRVLLTHDVRTMTASAIERVEKGLSMPGVIEVSTRTPMGQLIEDILIAVETGRPDDFENQVRYIPFR